LIGHARAKEYLLTDAARMGLINHAFPPTELGARVDSFADRRSGGALRAIRTTKMAVNIGLKQLAFSILDAWLALRSRPTRAQTIGRPWPRFTRDESRFSQDDKSVKAAHAAVHGGNQETPGGIWSHKRASRSIIRLRMLFWLALARAAVETNQCKTERDRT